MHVALAVALGSIAVAPFVGRWRANAWVQRRLNEAEMRAHATATRSRRNNIIEIA